MSLEPTPTSDSLRQAVADVASALGTPELARAAERCAEAMEAARDGFTNSLGTPSSTEGSAWVNTLIDSIYASFASCASQARQLATATEPTGASSQLAELEEGVHALLERVTMYEAYVYTTGPSRFPVQNALARAAGALLDEQIALPDFSQVLQSALDYFQASQAQAQELLTSDPSRAGLVASLGACIEALRVIERYLSEPDTRHFDEGFDALDRAQESVEKELTQNPLPVEPVGPTTSPLVNAYLQAAVLLEQGRLDRRYFAAQLERLREHVASMRRSLQSTRMHDGLPPSVLEQSARFAESVALHESAVANFEAYLANQDARLLHLACEHLIAATERLDIVRKAYEEGRHKQVICPHCGALSHGEASHCSDCDHALPRTRISADGQVFAESGDPDLPLTEHLFRIVEDTNHALNRTISAEAYQATLAWAQALARQTHAEVGQARPVDPARFAPEEREQAERVAELVGDTRDLLLQNLEAMQAALGELGRYLADGDERHLRDGLQALWAATRQISYAQRLGQQSARSLNPHDLEISSGEGEGGSVLTTA